MRNETIGFAGLGLMGSRMAARLIDEGWDVVVWNRSQGVADDLVAVGAKQAISPAELGAAASIVVSMVADDTALNDVYLGDGGVLAGMSAGGLVIEMSTTSLDATRALAAAASEQDIAVVDAPVFGSTEPARTGGLVIVVGGNDADVDRARHILECLGKRIFHLGPVGAGTVMKLAGNSIGAGTTALVAEALAFGTAAGLDATYMLEVMGTCGFNSALLQNRGAAALEGSFEPGWPIKHVIKDLGLAQAAGVDHGVSMRALECVRADYEAARQAGFGDADAAAVVKGVAT
jgi:3-hydroxyisobutyrate dehydrogenase-like beta-hydroxyacid dehydrogenase